METGERPERERRPLTALDVGKAGCLAALIVFCAYAVITLLRHQATESRTWAECQSNLIDLYVATRVYAADHAEHLPPAGGWCDALERPYLGGQDRFYCPKRPEAYGYAMNMSVGSAWRAEVESPSETPLYFESDAGQPNAADPVSSLPTPPRHQPGNNLIFVDGHYEVWKGTRPANLEMPR